ncbi:DNA binding protein-like protein SART-1 [Pyrenochaeta sp. DS3sAY3a]|nr:DNA binding protein-like protein SART-1 [Pyrenochaeta sp. DS3sAY3a]
MADFSVEEANKIRLSMGLPALPGPGAATTAPASKATKEDDGPVEDAASTFEARQLAAGVDNWNKHQEEATAKTKREERAAAIKKDREKAARFAKLEGKGLADDANDEDDMAWLRGSKKRQNKIAKAEQMQADLEERERREREAIQYTEADLAGVKVGHEVDQFDDEDQILVLKDMAVDGDDDDELEAVSLKEKERLQERLDSKKRKRVYDPNDMDESGQKSILAQYDEEIEGKKSKAFTLDGKGQTIERVQAAATSAARPNKVTINLDMLKDEAPANDYMDISEVKVKKPKKKKAKKAKRERFEEDEELLNMTAETAAVEMEVDDEFVAPLRKKKSVFDESFVDDDDLQASLALQRKKALKKRKTMRPEDLAAQIRAEQERADDPAEQPANEPAEESLPKTLDDVLESTEVEEDGALVIDETTEFLQVLGTGAAQNEKDEARRKRRKSSQFSNGDKPLLDDATYDEDGDLDMDMSYAESGDAKGDRDRSISQAPSHDINGTGLDAEKTIDQGVGATLALLRQRGVLATSDGTDKAASYRDRQQFLREKQRAEEEADRQRKLTRERERLSTRYMNSTTREREELSRKNNQQSEVAESRRLADIFNKEYKPNVELNYVDDHGRQMTQKEAFKKLSHQFHGKGSGNTKTKKHLEKIAAEKKKLSESSLEANRSGGGGFGNALNQQAKKHKTAGVRMQ